MEICRHFKGDRPCQYYWINGCINCNESENYNPYKERILIIKLDALGDVVRSTALAEGIKIASDSITYVPSGLIDMNRGHVLGHLHKAIKPVNQLRMIEYSLVIYRISNF